MGSLIPWWAAILGASVFIQYTELVNHTAKGGWLTVLPRTAIPILCAQFFLFIGWRGAPSLMLAWSYFTLTNTVARLGISWFGAGELFDWRTPLGVAVILAGGQLVKAGMR